ncbi:hypothetical protein [Synechococcus elongatus]|uniref:hypothetical protein n=1 Tax=Synechococcus elongatus TaxID=32046 RepID=UPI000F7D8122|nr:hypothetical protein [Synechococcus elongatus]
MASSPEFVKYPVIGFAELTTANTSRDGTGAIADLVTGVAGGTRIIEIRAKATGTISSGCLINIFWWTGTGWRLFDDLALSQRTPSNAATSASSIATYRNLLIPKPANKLGVSITVTPASGSVNVFALGGDLVSERV